MADLLGDTRLLTKGHFTELYVPENEREDYGTVIAKDVLENKIVGLFFSASWCAPCQHFVPVLKDIYTELLRRDENFQIVFVSFDKTKDEMMNYYRNTHGNWLSLKYDDPMKSVLAQKYSINVIPKLIIIQPNGDVITSKGRKDIQDKGIVCMRTWQAGLVVRVDKQEDSKLVDLESHTQDASIVR